ncbi:MAG: phosphotransferase [Actinomycetota bacterium]|nr:phosphotransferase [Actinomycetota bacterium]
MTGPADRAVLLEGIDARTLTRVARRALGMEKVELIGWCCRSLWEPRIASTLGVYQITAEVTERESSSVCALVLKVLAAAGAGVLPREAELYDSGVLASLQGGLVAPECFGVTELPGGGVAVWLEHVEDDSGPGWPLEQFGRVASHLGYLAISSAEPAASAARSVPPRNLCALHQLCEQNLAQLEESQSHPLVRRAYPPSLTAGFRRLWEEGAAVLEAVARVPYLVCHGDAQRRNLFSRQDADGHERTVAIDWANFSTAPVAMDIATLVHYALVYFDVDAEDALELDRRVFQGYLEGLRSAGWSGGAGMARFAYAAQMSLGLGLLEIRPVLRTALDEGRHAWAEGFYGRPLGQILDRRAAVGRFLLDLGREAQSLIGVVT